MNNKTPPNTAALDSLKNQGYKLIVNHYRRVAVKNLEDNGWTISLIPDFEWRKYFHTNFYDLPEEKGGATELTLLRGEEKIVVRVDCYIKDSFSRRLGVKAALDKLKKLYDIN